MENEIIIEVQGFTNAYKGFNEQQKKAVDTIDGPVLVIAGPGTGKTQLLSTRVANIIKKTDTTPANILCLTFTDNAARNMRERLESIIGQPAYHVAIHTFHSFGGEIINQYADYFTDRQLLQQIDELGQYELLRTIFEELPHSNPLSTKVGDEFIHLQNTLSAISWLKQNAIAPYELHEIISNNQKFIDTVADELAETFSATPSPKKMDLYLKLLQTMQAQASSKLIYGFANYATASATEFARAIEATNPNRRFAPAITAWRNRWCQKNAQGLHVFKDGGVNMRKMHALANVYQKMVDIMALQGLYDFEDMIVEVVHAMEHNDELRLNLQERYQYILVDEFQDTNKAQLRMLTALGDNPVYEGRPNIMAVGDDDQAIYSFQGAEVSNMAIFANQYRSSALITLRDNYRSTANILEVGFSVAGQISDRLESVLPDTHKELVVRAKHNQDVLEHSVFPSELAQYDWIAQQIKSYLEKCTQPQQIAVIAPRHRYLERLMPYLVQYDIPVAYERRENILDAPIIHQLLTMSRLIVALAENRQDEIDYYLSVVLAYDFWELPAETLLEISMACYKQNKHWLEAIATHKDKHLKQIVDWFMTLAKRSTLEPMEYMLDRLTGTVYDGADSEYDDLLLPRQKQDDYVSPLRKFYFNRKRYEHATDSYLALLGQLSTLRHRLRHWKPASTLYIKDLVEFANLHAQANLKIIDTNPHTQSTNAVQVMTAYKAKGLEFEAVFAINAQDEIWGPTARSRSSTVTLPKNLPIAPAGDSNDDKLRLLFVALTRAKKILHITGYTHNLDNKLTPGLSFIGGSNPDESTVHPKLVPKKIEKPVSARAVEILSTDWAYRFRQIIADKPTLLEPILKDYKLSVTHLNNFLDVKDGGPQYFFLHNLLRFPEALTPAAAYGDAMHKTLQWVHSQLRRTQKMPPINKIQDCFSDLLKRKHLRKFELANLDQRGCEALKYYFKNRKQSLRAQDLVERGFNNEGVMISDANLSGKIDSLRFMDKGQVQVIDFKTGKPARSWQGRDEYEKIKLHKYRQQLLFYKLLVENSASFSKKVVVNSGALEFIEADENGKLLDNLELKYDSHEIQQFIKLIGAVWNRIMELDFPDVSKYPPTLAGMQAFEKDLINQ